ncbi:MAG: nucleotide-diphospho-sugar transferase [Benjaminiella poitrasii]|nr:MAG: nucleotide-diphospho-sugar transferase [Benjaminiella poitrasii]
MRLKALIERKGLLAIGFIVTIVTLYRLASHPVVDKLMQPITYYRNNDVPVCLPDKYLAKQNPVKKAKAAIVILTRNNERDAIAETIVNFEEKFNKNFHYPYVFLNNVPFNDDFKSAIRHVVSPETELNFGLIPKEHWGYPDWIDLQKAAEARQEMEAKGHNKQYGFVITLKELQDTIPTLWNHVLEYAKTRHINVTNNKKLAFPYFFDERGEYNTCHFWSNFEIASLNLWRSPQYRDFFHYLDKTGNFFYERWGDAPVHSLAAGLFLDTDQLHYFEDFGYQHDLYRHCPTKESKLGCRCQCPEGTNGQSIDHDQNWDTCLPVWREWVETDKTRKAEWDFSYLEDYVPL